MSENLDKSRKYDEVACFDLTQISEGILDFEEIDLDFWSLKIQKFSKIVRSRRFLKISVPVQILKISKFPKFLEKSINSEN